MITIFKTLSSINEPFRIELRDALRRIKEGKSKEIIEQIRQDFREGKDVELLKKSLPFVVFSASQTKETTSKRSGKPTHREDECVVEHSGVFVLDFDDCDVQQKIEQLRKDPYIHACWVGPKGNGVKALVQCPPSIENHNLYYTAFLERYPELDATSRNISRGTFESYDPNLFFNERSLTWDKKVTEEQRKKNKENEVNRKGKSILSTAVAMVRTSVDGEKHSTLLKAATLVGGYVAAGRVDESEALQILEEEIRAKNPKDMRGAIQTVKDGISYGKQRPLAEAKKIEKSQQYLIREDGTYDFLADNSEMTEYEVAVVNGTLEMGLPTGINSLNPFWMFKKNTIVWWIGIDNVGKSFLVWYLAVLAAMFHGWKFIIHSAENGDGQLRKKLKEFYIGKSIKLMDDEELTIAHDFVNTHFRIISSSQMHSVEDFLFKCEVVIDGGYDADVVIGEPWNSFDEKVGDRYSNLIHNLNLVRVFKENYCAFWAADHVNTFAARGKDKEGYAAAPNKADAEMGTMKASKADDFIVIHRIGNHPLKKKETQLHVQKIKDEETGGQKTDKDNPVILELNNDYCGYHSNYVDPVKEYWKKKRVL